MASDLPPDSPSRSPDKRLKAPMQESESICAVNSNHQHYGSEPEESSMVEESESESCGICLSDGERLVRGVIDSCDHFFCFVCIMEWSKVESRCPLCKRRFSIIFRPVKVGVFASERVVSIPHRDQGNYSYGNATSRRASDPSQGQCSACQSSVDEHLLLLCDLCDAASHTYCVGLGATVPEGDWFCDDCAIAKAERDRELDTGAENYYVKLEPKNEVSIFDIVRETDDRWIERSNSNLSPPSNGLSPTFDSGRGSRVSTEVAGSSERPTQSIIAGKASEHCCRNMHGRIQAIRENWHALRTGSASFASSLAESRGRGKQKGIGSPNFGVRMGESETSASISQQSTAPDGRCGNALPMRDSYDVNKAWKMMRMANSIKSNHEKARVVTINRPSRATLSLGESSKEVTGSSSGVNLSERQQFKTKSVSRHEENHHKRNFLEMIAEKNRAKNIGSSKRPPANSSGLSGSASSKKVRLEGNISSVSARLLLENAHGASSSSTKEQGGLSSSLTLVGSVLGRSTDSLDANEGQALRGNISSISARPLLENIRGGASCSTNEQVGLSSSSTLVGSVPGRSTNTLNANEGSAPSTSSSKSVLPGGKIRANDGNAKDRDRRDDDAKSEIQSLVKHNLKLVSKDKRLGVDAFKEVARVATHSILAACGLEHSKSRARSFPRSVCNHSGKTNTDSTLLPNSCRKCFSSFVKDVVSSILSEKVGHDR